MADSAVAITAGTGTNIDTRTEGTNSNHRQVIVIGDPATNAGVAPVDATAGVKVDLGADNDVTVTGTVTANLSATDNTVLDNIDSATSRLTSSASTIDPGSQLATTAFQVGSQYDSTQKTLTDGQSGSFAMSSRGAMLVNPGAETFNVTVNAAIPAGTNNIGDVDVLTIGGQSPAYGSGAVGATVPRVTLATDSPGIFAAGLADGSASLSAVLAKDSIKYVTVDMTAETTALDAGDVVAATQIVAACTPANDAPGILQSIVVIDPDDQGAELNLVFFSANTTLGTEDTAPDIDDTEVQTVIGIINVATTDYKDLGLSKVATLRNVGLPILPATGTDDIYVGIYTPGTPTYAGGHIYLRLGFM